MLMACPLSNSGQAHTALIAARTERCNLGSVTPSQTNQAVQLAEASLELDQERASVGWRGNVTLPITAGKPAETCQLSAVH